MGLPLKKDLSQKYTYKDYCNWPDKLDIKGLRGAPDLVIEIISPATAGRDMKEKFYLYEHHKVKEYWIVAPYDRSKQNNLK